MEKGGKARWAAALTAAALLAGGGRAPLIGAAAELAAFYALWRERPALGPAAAWLPWLAWAALSAAASSQPLAALSVLAKTAAALAMASLAASWDRYERQRWLKSLLAAAAVLAVAALIDGAGKGYAQFMLGLMPPYYNYTAFALAAAAAAGGAWALHPRGPRGAWRAFASAVAALAAFCAVLSTSRGATLGLALASAVWACRRWRRRGAAAVLAAALAALGAWRALSTLPRAGAAARAAALKTYRPYAEVRPKIWRAALETARESPWLGEGPGNFLAGFRRHPVPAPGAAARWGMWSGYAHSEPLQAAAETGFVGAALWLLGAAALWSALFSEADEDPAREAAAAALAAMTVQLFVDDMLQIPGLAFLVFTAGALAGARPRGGRRWPRAFSAAGAALAVGAAAVSVLAQDPARAAVLFPRDPLPLEDLAYRAQAAGRAGEADSLWTKAAERAPFDAIYPWRRAQLAAARGDWRAALALAARALALEPDFSRARTLRALALARLGERAEARAELEEVARRRARPARYAGSAYDRAVSSFDPAEFERARVAAGLPAHFDNMAPR